MASNVVAAIRRCPQLNGNKKFTAQEVAHLMNKSGYGRVAYTFMAMKTGYCRRTVIRHMRYLTDERIYEKTVYRLQNGYAINLYKCLLPIPAFYRASPHGSSGDRLSPILPPAKAKEEKSLSLREEIARLRKGMRWWTEDSEQYAACLDELARLEALEQ